MTYPLWYKGALMYIDRIDLSLPEEDFQSVLEAFASAAATLQQLPSVSPSDRKHYARLGLKNEALTLQIIEVGRTHRHLIPAGMDFEKIDRDLAAREQLRVLKLLLQNLLERVSDSMLLTGVDLYAAALSMYHCLRRNADTAGLKSTVAELKKGFARPSRKKKEQQEAPETPAVPAAAPASDRLVSRPEPDGRASATEQGSAAPKAGALTNKVCNSRGSLPPPIESASELDAAERHGSHPSLSSTPRTHRVVAAFHALPVMFSGGFTGTVPGYWFPEWKEEYVTQSGFCSPGSGRKILPDASQG